MPPASIASSCRPRASDEGTAALFYGLGPAAGLQGFWPPIFGGGLDEKLGDRNAEHRDDLVEDVDGGVFHRPFEPADIGAVNPGQFGELVLRQLLFDPQPPHVPRDQFATIHKNS